MSNFRGVVKDKATATVPDSYGLKNLNVTDRVVTVNNLLHRENYIYPQEVCDYPSPSYFETQFDVQKGKFLEHKPFCHPAIITILHEAFFGAKPAARFLLTTYHSSISQGHAARERELPMSMVALATTTVSSYFIQYLVILTQSYVVDLQAYVGLLELQSGTFNRIPFDGQTYAKQYRDHLASLQAIRKSDVVMFHRLMSYLFRATRYVRLVGGRV